MNRNLISLDFLLHFCVNLQGGKSTRVVNSVLALKSYNDWKQMGGNGAWKFGGNIKSATLGKSFVRKNSEHFMNSLSRSSSINGKTLNANSSDLNSNKMVINDYLFKIYLHSLYFLT